MINPSISPFKCLVDHDGAFQLWNNSCNNRLLNLTTVATSSYLSLVYIYHYIPIVYP